MEKIINVKTLLENRKAKDNNGSNKFYNIINTIGENNTTAWKVLNEAVKEERECGYDDIIRLDFKGITVGTPYFNDYFKLLLNDRNVVFQLYNSKEVVDNINSMAILGGLEGMKNEKRAENEEIVYVEEKKVDKVLLRKVEDLKKACFVLEDGKYKIDSIYYSIKGMTEKEKENKYVESFKCSLFDDLVINIEDIFRDIRV